MWKKIQIIWWLFDRLVFFDDDDDRMMDINLFQNQ